MNTIELEHWIPDPEHPHKLKYVGQPTAQEVFEELKYCLYIKGYLPDVDFLMDKEWENGREIPKGADIFCAADYSVNDGICMNVYLKWCEDGKPVTKIFATGTTWGETGADLDRMFLLASVVTKAFYIGDFNLESVIYLDDIDQRTVVNALVEQREKEDSALTQTERLLRRITGSIVSYMDIVGKRPLHMGNSDKAVLTIRDGDIKGLKELLPRLFGREVYNELLLEAASRPGGVGRKTTMLILDNSKKFCDDVYKEACERAVRIVDPEKVALLQEQAHSHAEDLPPDFFGNLALYAYNWQGANSIAEQIIERCSQEEVFAAPTSLLEMAMVSGNMDIPKAMAQKGVNGDRALRPFIKCRGQEEPWKIEALLDMGMKVSMDNYDALAACVEYKCPEIGKALIDHGVDFEGFSRWAEWQEKDISCDTYQELAGYWQERRQQEPGQEQSM